MAIAWEPVNPGSFWVIGFLDLGPSQAMGLPALIRRSKVALSLRERSWELGGIYRSRTPKALPGGASLSLISAERDGYFADAMLATSG
jgi:hypothetical protein